ncbi:hypothetical protein Pint_05803 [Pistacia integerrima]|uniref:Uncharacterized protein n=1 Tax=Pistacia integerrima TaxID=434235 RepID=A0ACC0Z4Y3_9ROSI|nr:hypothetical protein Pint_05803 [Pistacia integerrima]
MAGDPDITTDFVVPMNYSGNGAVDGNFFTFTGLCNVVNSDYTQTFTVTKATATNFPALDGQSVSYAFLQFPAGAINPPHTHPHSAELLLLETCLCFLRDWCIISLMMIQINLLPLFLLSEVLMLAQFQFL